MNPDWEEEMEEQNGGFAGLAGLVSQNPQMEGVFKLIEKVAPEPSNVVIVGETGSGKELVARAIHNQSKQKNSPFIAINCASLNETLLEDELFGHERGAFTGANSRKSGLFELAHGGTIFFDEITELSDLIQSRLLRALETKTFRRVGGNELIEVDARILVASQEALERTVEKGKFRNDLYYRICTIEIHIPPLRSRVEDIPLLVDHFLKRFRKAHHGKPPKKISQGVLDLFSGYKWPGNVRELENTLERAYILSDDETITEKDLPPVFFGIEKCRIVDLEQQNCGSGLLTLKQRRKRHVLWVLKQVGENKTKAARILGINRKTLYRMRRDWRINR